MEAAGRHACLLTMHLQIALPRKGAAVSVLGPHAILSRTEGFMSTIVMRSSWGAPRMCLSNWSVGASLPACRSAGVHTVHHCTTRTRTSPVSLELSCSLGVPLQVARPGIFAGMKVGCSAHNASFHTQTKAGLHGSASASLKQYKNCLTNAHKLIKSLAAALLVTTITINISG